MKIGYVRVSTSEQHAHLQQDALKLAGCERIFEDVASGKLNERPGLAQAIASLQQGDTLVVWKLDRLGRSLQHLIDTVNGLKSRGIGFSTLQDQIDTTTSGGKLIFHVFGALAEFERELIRERTAAGLKAARARGSKFGRPKAMDRGRIDQAKTLLSKHSVDQVCETMGICRATLYRYLKREPIHEPSPLSITTPEVARDR